MELMRLPRTGIEGFYGWVMRGLVISPPIVLSVWIVGDRHVLRQNVAATAAVIRSLDLCQNGPTLLQVQAKVTYTGPLQRYGSVLDRELKHKMVRWVPTLLARTLLPPLSTRSAPPRHANKKGTCSRVHLFILLSCAQVPFCPLLLTL